jgi:SAM-dependent methyltransferase
MNCRITKEKCKIFLDLGKMPLANGFLKTKDFKHEYFFNLQVAFSKSLSLVQLVSNPKPQKMFNKYYPFYTSSSKFMVSHFKKYSDWIKKKFIKKDGSILEIGSNDGTFLNNFKNYFGLGFEPSKSVHSIAISNKVKSINKFFNSNNIKILIKKKIKFDVIVGSNVICHIPDQNDLIKSINKLINENGTIIFEEPYLGAMYSKVSYDQIYDEHIYMFSASSIKKIWNLFDYQLVDAIPQITHGGSMRYVIKKGVKQKTSKRLKNILKHEKRKSINMIRGGLIFKKKVEKSKKDLIKKLSKIKRNGHNICGYGATSKSTTILNYCKINTKLIDCIFDTTKDKINKFSPGMHIPIIDYKFFKKSNYKKIFLFAWNHKKEILLKEKNKKNIQWFSHL